MKGEKFCDKASRLVFLTAALAMVCALAFICFFIFAGGASAIRKIGLANFLLGRTWRPEIETFGILPMMAGSFLVTAIALAIVLPLGIFCAVFVARFCPRRAKPLFVAGIDLLASVPSVVYGFTGLMTIVPAVRALFGGSGASALAASLVLCVMILPTVASISRASIEAVEPRYLEGALALGDSVERGVFHVELKVCSGGVAAAAALALGRAMGETMAVIMVAGNQPVMPRSLFKGVRTLTANIALEMGYASGVHRDALTATAAVLFLFILAVNMAVAVLQKKSRVERR